MEKLGLNPKFFAVVLVAAATGCSQGTVGIGDQQPSAQQKTGLAAFAATWDGYVEAYKFTDGSDRVRITVAEDGTGSVRFGNDALLPTPTDPNVKFPPDFPQCLNCGLFYAMPDVWNGFMFSLNDVRVDADRLSATATNQEIFAAWCKLQTSRQTVYPRNGGYHEYGCGGCVGVSFAGDGTITDICSVPTPCSDYVNVPPVDAGTETTYVPGLCEREVLCNGSSGTVFSEVKLTCVCDANGCSIGAPDQNIILDAALADNQATLTGTLALTKASGSPTTNYTIRLKRQ